MDNVNSVCLCHWRRIIIGSDKLPPSDRNAGRFVRPKPLRFAMPDSVFLSISRCGGIAQYCSTLLACFLAISIAAGLPAAEKQTAKSIEKRPLKIVFAGDVMLDGGPGHALSNNEDIFTDVASLLTPADISVCNLECVITRHGHGTHQLKSYTFKARPEAIPVLKKYFSAVLVRQQSCR